MKQAFANSGKLIRKPSRPAAMAGSAASGSEGLGREPLAARPMVRAAGLRTQDDRRLRARRLPEAQAPVPAISRLVYRAGSVQVR